MGKGRYQVATNFVTGDSCERRYDSLATRSLSRGGHFIYGNTCLQFRRASGMYVILTMYVGRMERGNQNLKLGKRKWQRHATLVHVPRSFNIMYYCQEIQIMVTVFFTSEVLLVVRHRTLLNFEDMLQCATAHSALFVRYWLQPHVLLLEIRYCCLHSPVGIQIYKHNSWFLNAVQ